jgi:hypothetical protein
MPLTTFFHQNKSASLLTKSNTFSHKPTTEPPTLVRSNTFSKVKRLGSLLVRNNKKSSPPRVDTIFPSPIDTSLASSYSLSSSCTHTHSSSDEDELMTPKEMTFQPLVSPTVIDDDNVQSVTPELQTNQIQENTSIKGEQQKQQIISLDTTSQELELETTVSTAQEIIEQELESHHVQMLHSISMIPSIVY